jgi:hypothetical protein
MIEVRGTKVLERTFPRTARRGAAPLVASSSRLLVASTRRSKKYAIHAVTVGKLFPSKVFNANAFAASRHSLPSRLASPFMLQSAATIHPHACSLAHSLSLPPYLPPVPNPNPTLPPNMAKTKNKIKQMLPVDLRDSLTRHPHRAHLLEASPKPSNPVTRLFITTKNRDPEP